METPQPGPSSSTSPSDTVIDLTCETDETYGIETHNLLRQIVHGLHNEIYTPNKALTTISFLERAGKFTGFHPETLKKLYDSNTLVYIYKEIDRKKIHELLIYHCLKWKRYPTLTHLFYVMRVFIPPYVDKQTFLRILIKMGFIFKKLAMGSEAPGIAERPEITFERYLYLNKITEYRNCERNIFFIGEASATPGARVFNLDETAANSTNKSLVRFMYIISSNSGLINLHIVDEFDAANFEHWIKSGVIYKLPESSVVVLDNSKHHNEQFCQPPESLEKSLKEEIKEWLKYHHVPYSDNMSKVQLWELAEKYTNIEANVFVIDNVLKVYGHDVLRLPNCINDLSLATGVRHFIKSVLKMEDSNNDQTLLTTLRRIGNTPMIINLKEYNLNLIQEEKRILWLDVQFEDVKVEMESSYDLLTSEDEKHKLLHRVDMELPYFSDSD